MVTDNAIMNIKEVKHCEAEDAWVVVVGEEDDDVEDDNDGDDSGRMYIYNIVGVKEYTDLLFCFSFNRCWYR